MIRATLAGLAVVAVLVVSGPWIIYGVALAKIAGRPDAPAAAASAQQLDLLRSSLRAHGPLDVPQLSPWQYLLALITDPKPLSSPGVLAAWSVARDYNATNLGKVRAVWWHASGAALTIWLTRNWTEDQILARASQLAESAPSNKPLQPTRVAEPNEQREARVPARAAERRRSAGGRLRQDPGSP